MRQWEYLESLDKLANESYSKRVILRQDRVAPIKETFLGKGDVCQFVFKVKSNF